MKTPFEVTFQQFDQLTKQEQSLASNNGSGREYANYIRIVRNDKTILLENDAMEPEDARFSRDLKWILKAIESAYQYGLVDGEFKPLTT